MDTGIGFQAVGPEKKRRKTTQPTPTPPSGNDAQANSVPQQPQPKGQAKRKASAPSSDLADLVKAAESSTSAFKSFSPLQFFQGGLKTRDVDKRLNLAFQTQSSLEEHMLTSPEAQKVGKELSDSAQVVTEWMDIITPFLDTDSCLRHIRSMDPTDIEKFAKKIPSDCMHAILLDVSKKLWEDFGLLFNCQFFLAFTFNLLTKRLNNTLCTMGSRILILHFFI